MMLSSSVILPTSLHSFNESIDSTSDLLDYISIGDSGPHIKREDGFVVEYWLKSLKQNHDWVEWEPIYVTFSVPDKLPTVLSVAYRITAANIPEPIKGELRIHLEHSETAQSD